MSQIQVDMQSLKEAINTPPNQYAASLDTNPVALQQQLFKIKEDMKHLQQMKHIYPTTHRSTHSLRTFPPSTVNVLLIQRMIQGVTL